MFLVKDITLSMQSVSCIRYFTVTLVLAITVLYSTRIFKRLAQTPKVFNTRAITVIKIQYHLVYSVFGALWLVRFTSFCLFAIHLKVYIALITAFVFCSYETHFTILSKLNQLGLTIIKVTKVKLTRIFAAFKIIKWETLLRLSKSRNQLVVILVWVLLIV